MAKYHIFSILIFLYVSKTVLTEHTHKHKVTELIYDDFEFDNQQLPSDSNSTANPIQEIPNAYSGYLSVNDPNSNSKLFYIFYECRGLSQGQVASDVPIIIWLQGGPGEGSELSAFYEMGPYGLTYDQSRGKYTEAKRAVSWNDYYNLLFIDNPRGSGYSIADKGSFVTSEDQIVEDLLNALQNFYGLSQFQTFTKTPLYVFGNGYAGHYIPSFARKILEQNSGLGLKIPLTGIAIGNGLVDPLNQFAGNGLFAFSLGLVDDVQREEIELVQLEGIGNIINGNYIKAKDDFEHVINIITSYGGGLNVYNYRNFGSYDFSGLTSFFNNPDTVNRYNVDPSVAGKYSSLSANVSANLANSTMQSSTDDLTYVLNANLSTLIYAGQDDLIYNTVGIQNWIANLEWYGQSALFQSNFNIWVSQNGTIAGLQKNLENFYFAVVNKAGHFSSMDQISTTTEMVRRFINNQTDWTLSP